MRISLRLRHSRPNPGDAVTELPRSKVVETSFQHTKSASPSERAACWCLQMPIEVEAASRGRSLSPAHSRTGADIHTISGKTSITWASVPLCSPSLPIHERVKQTRVCIVNHTGHLENAEKRGFPSGPRVFGAVDRTRLSPPPRRRSVTAIRACRCPSLPPG